MAQHKALTYVDLSYNSLGTQCAKVLGRILSTNRVLREVDLRWNAIGNEGTKCIASGALHGAKRSKLCVLRLSFNGIGDDGAEALAQMLSANTPLRVLDLGHNKFGSAGAACIAVALQVRVYTSTLGSQQTRGLYKRNSHRSTLCAAQLSTPRTRSFWQPIV